MLYAFFHIILVFSKQIYFRKQSCILVFIMMFGKIIPKDENIFFFFFEEPKDESLETKNTCFLDSIVLI